MYLNLIQIAESFGVQEKMVDDWIRNEGLPYVSDRGRLIFDRAQVAAWAAERGLAAQAGFLAAGNPAIAGGFELDSLLRSGGIWRDVPAAEAAETSARIVGALPGVSDPVRQLLARKVRAADGINWAPVGGGFALPHLRARVALGRDSGAVAVLLLQGALPMSEPPDDVPITRLVFFLAPSPRTHLELLGRLSRSLVRGPLRERLREGAADEAIYAAVASGDVQP